MTSILRVVRQTRLVALSRFEPSKFRQLSTTTASTAAESEENLEESLRKKILENSLKFVTEFGFSTEAITRGVTEAGLSTAATNGIFSKGAFDLIDFFYKKSNADLADYLEGVVREGSVTRKNELVRIALIHRLKLTQPYVRHWPQAMAQIASNPLYALTSIENLLRLCDEIWYQLGDDSVDVSLSLVFFVNYFSIN
jgi:rpsU-divergently transcribed protein